MIYLTSSTLRAGVYIFDPKIGASLQRESSHALNVSLDFGWEPPGGTISPGENHPTAIAFLGHNPVSSVQARDPGGDPAGGGGWWDPPIGGPEPPGVASGPDAGIDPEELWIIKGWLINDLRRYPGFNPNNVVTISFGGTYAQPPPTAGSFPFPIKPWDPKPPPPKSRGHRGMPPPLKSPGPRDMDPEPY